MYELGSATEKQDTWIFSTDFRKNSQIPYFIKIRPVGAEMFHAVQQTRRNWQSFFAILGTRLETRFFFSIFQRACVKLDPAYYGTDSGWGCWRRVCWEHLDLRCKKEHEAGEQETCTTRSWVISSLRQFFLFFCGAATQRGSWPPHSWGFLDHTQRRTTVGRTPMDEQSACRRELYLTTHNTHNRQTSTPPVAFKPMISAGERPQTYALDRAATGTGTKTALS